MKRIFLSLLILITLSIPSFAYEELIINSAAPVTEINNKTPQIIKVEALTTILNERNTIFVSVRQAGQAEFDLTLETGKKHSFKLNITDTNTEITRNSKEFDIFIIDDYAKEMEIDLPPGVKWNK